MFAIVAVLLLQITADSLFERASSLQTSGRLDEAQAAWNEYLKKYGPKPEALANLGALLARRERYPEAIEHYKAALKLDSSLAPLHLNLGLAYLKQGQAGQAVSEFDTFLKAQPKHRQAQQLRAMALLESERYANAEAQYRALGTGDPSVALGLGTSLLRQNKAAEARQVLEPVLANSTPEVQLVLGQLLLQESRVDDALATLEQVRQSKPDLPGLHVAIGIALWRQRRTAEAIKEWRAEESFEAAYLLGSALAMNDATREEGEAHLRKALRLRPGNPRANYALGKLIWQREKNPEALKFLGRAIQTDPLFREAFFLRATVLQSLGRKSEAAKSFARVKELSARELERQQDLFSESSP